MLDPSVQLGNSEKSDGYETALASQGATVAPSLIVDPGGHDAAAGYGGMTEVMKPSRPPYGAVRRQ